MLLWAVYLGLHAAVARNVSDYLSITQYLLLILLNVSKLNGKNGIKLTHPAENSVELLEAQKRCTHR